MPGGQETAVQPASRESTAAPRLEQDIRRLRALQRAGRHAEALRDADPLLREAPENRDLLLLSAIGLRNLGRIAEALAVLARIERREPRFSRLHQERGLCFLALKDTPQAMAAFGQAVDLNPALAASWELLEGLWRAAGDMQQAARAAGQVAFAEAPADGHCRGDLAALGRRDGGGRKDRPRLSRAPGRPSRSAPAVGADRSRA